MSTTSLVACWLRRAAAPAAAIALLSSASAQTVTEVLDASGDGLGHPLEEPGFCAVDASGDLLVSGFVSDNVFRVTPAGVVTEILSGPSTVFDGAGGITADAAGNVFVTGILSNNTFRIAPGGQVTEILDFTGDGQSPVVRPWGVAVDSAGNAFVSSENTDFVFKITPVGAVSVIITGTGDGAGNALDRPEAICVDGSGNVYVTGNLSDNVFKITPGGVITEIIDASGDGAGNTLERPFGIAVDGAEHVFVVGYDSDNAFRIELPLGSAYCGPANPNSSGLPAEITATGSDAVLANFLHVTATQLPVGQFGYFIASRTQGAFVPPGSQGVLCLSGNIGRYNQPANLIQGPSGTLQVDLTAIPVNPTAAVQSGETWNFQCWFRDSNPGVTSNFTNGVSILFL